jgi:glutamate racemase
VLVIGTPGTISEGAYERAIVRRAPATRVRGRACPLFVALAEEGWIDGEVPRAVVRRHLGDALDEVDTLVLGCTHFPVLREPIAAVVGPGVVIVDSARTTAAAVAHALAAGAAGGSRTGGPGEIELWATDSPERFARAGPLFLGEPIREGAVALVDL